MKDKYEFKVMSDRENVFFLENGKLDIKSEIEALSYYPITIEIREERDDNENEGDLVAKITGLFFDIDNMRNCDFSLFEVFDSIDQNIYELYEALFKDEEYRGEFDILDGENLFYLDYIIVEEAYRNKGICKMIIKQIDEIIKYIAGLKVDVIATNLDVHTGKEINQKLDRLLIDKCFIKASHDDNYYVLNFID